MNHKNFGLSEESFKSLAEELKQEKEDLFENIFLNHFDNSVTFLMRKYGAAREVAYDICMDSLLYFRKLLLNDKIHYGNLRALFNQISAQKYLKYIDKQKKMKATKIIPQATEEENRENENNLLLLNTAWNRLGEECQYILRNYYYNNRRLYEIAEQLSKTAVSIRKQKERCINSLRMNFRQIS